MGGTYLEETETLAGLTREARCSFSTLLVMVAENRNVRRSRGMRVRI